MRICILFLLTISPIVIFCQTKYSSYVSSYFKNKVFDIRINYENENSYTLYIDMQSKENINNGGIIISSGEHQKFIDTLLKVQLKYNEWTKVAKTNNVKEVSKQMELDFTIPLSYFEYGRRKQIEIQI
ncbi:MAG: hypothetical protein IPN10_15285 [Saprospiraceae bacterium]|nr:hypothetical protein [Saprospiraceae bacterium]